MPGGRGGSVCPASPDTTVVRLTNTLTYVPDTLRIPAGATVEWKNSSLLVHTVTDDPALATIAGSAARPRGAAAFNSGNLAPGNSFVHRFTVPGVYHYFCIPHEAAKMRGVVLVGRPARR